MLTYVQTRDGITMVINGKIRVVSTSDQHFEEVLAIVKKNDPDTAVAEVQAVLERELRKVEAAVAALTHKITDDVVVDNGVVKFRGAAINTTLTQRMLTQLNEGFNLVPMARFLANLMENPSYRAVQDLYAFLEYGKMPITPDGCFLAYKAVRADFMDIYSGTFDNTPGRAPIKVPRNMVDEDPTRTCSHGLHVCSFDYLPHFSHADGHVVICKVNPRDVVAIPTDYHNTKMRVCEYSVIEEYTDYYKEHPECLMSKVSVATAEAPFELVIRGNEPGRRAFARLSDAAFAADEAIAMESTEEVTITNVTTGNVVDSRSNPAFEGYRDDESDFDEDEEEDEDEDEEQDPTYEVVYWSSPTDVVHDASQIHESGITSLLEAKRLAFELHTSRSPAKVAVRLETPDWDENGEVLLTLS